MSEHPASLSRARALTPPDPSDTFWVDLRTLRRMLAKYDVAKDWFGALSRF